LGVEAHERASSRFADLVRSLPPEPRPVVGSEWSTVEVGAHVLSVFRGYTRAAAGIAPLWPSLDGVAGNQRLLDETPERNPGELADAIDVAGEEMRAALRDSDAPIAAFGDVAVSGACILGINTASNAAKRATSSRTALSVALSIVSVSLGISAGARSPGIKPEA
jgi:hypothetical protein